MLRRLFGKGRDEAPAAARRAQPPEPGWPSDPHQAIAAALDSLDRGEETFATFVSDPRANRYVQVVTAPDGSLHGEAVSNSYLEQSAQLDEGAMADLKALGWSVAVGPEDNFSRDWSEWRRYRPQIVADLLDTLTRVYGMPPSGPIQVRTGR